MVEGTGLIIRFLIERHWFKPSRMHYNIFIINFFSIMIIKNKQKYIYNLENQYIKKNLPEIKIGDAINIGIKISEGIKERIQYYEGIVIAKKNSSINKTIIVRKIFQGIAVERIFLIHSPRIVSIEILKSSKIRRAKLYYLRKLSGKASRLKQLLSLK